MPKVKLIRDKLVPRGAGVRKVEHKSEHAMALVNKLYEEVSEVADCMSDPAEYGDVLQALQALAKLNEVPWAEVERVRREKFEARGGFDLGLVMRR